jgi:hypothetical protein
VDATAVRDHLVAEFGEEGLSDDISYGLLTVTVEPGEWRRTAEFLRRDTELS